MKWLEIQFAVHLHDTVEGDVWWSPPDTFVRRRKTSVRRYATTYARLIVIQESRVPFDLLSDLERGLVTLTGAWLEVNRRRDEAAPCTEHEECLADPRLAEACGASRLRLAERVAPGRERAAVLAHPNALAQRSDARRLEAE